MLSRTPSRLLGPGTTITTQSVEQQELSCGLDVSQWFLVQAFTVSMFWAVVEGSSVVQNLACSHMV